MSYSFVTYFPNGMSPAKLATEILPNTFVISNNNVVITNAITNEPALLSLFSAHVPNATPFAYFYNFTVVPTDDILTVSGASHIEDKILYFDTIPNLTTLNSTLASYVPAEIPVPVDFVKYASQNYLLSNNNDKLTVVQPNDIIVSKNSGQFTTISAAIAYIGTLSNTSVIIRVFPGTYMENNPLILPNYTCLRGEGSGGNTTIIGINPGVVIQIGDMNCVENFAIAGGTITIAHNGSNVNAFSMVKNSLISVDNSATALSVYGGMGSLIVSCVSIVSTGTGTNTGKTIIVNGASLIASELMLQTPSECGMEMSGGVATLNVASFYYCTHGIRAKNGAIIRATLINAISCGTGLSLEVNDVLPSVPSVLAISNLNIELCTTDINCDENVVVNIFGGRIDLAKITGTKTLNFCGVFQHTHTMPDSSLKPEQILTGETYINGSLETSYVEKTLTTYTDATPQLHISSSAQIYCFEVKGVVTAVNSYTGTWTPVNFIQDSNIIWLDLNYVSNSVAVNSITAQWLQVSGATVEQICSDTIMLSGQYTYYLGQSRKKIIHYMDCTSGTKAFTADNADFSTVYTVRVIAGISGITIGGQLFSATDASKTFTLSALNTFTVNGTTIQMIQVSYYVYKQ